MILILEAIVDLVTQEQFQNMYDLKLRERNLIDCIMINVALIRSSKLNLYVLNSPISVLYVQNIE
jgi:hypothetical protein